LGLRHELQFPENPNTPRETVTVQLTGFSNCLLQNVEQKAPLGVAHQGDISRRLCLLQRVVGTESSCFGQSFVQLSGEENANA